MSPLWIYSSSSLTDPLTSEPPHDNSLPRTALSFSVDCGLVARTDRCLASLLSATCQHQSSSRYGANVCSLWGNSASVWWVMHTQWSFHSKRTTEWFSAVDSLCMCPGFWVQQQKWLIFFIKQFFHLNNFSLCRACDERAPCPGFTLTLNSSLWPWMEKWFMDNLCTAYLVYL